MFFILGFKISIIVTNNTQNDFSNSWYLLIGLNLSPYLGCNYGNCIMMLKPIEIFSWSIQTYSLQVIIEDNQPFFAGVNLLAAGYNQNNL